jgi:hypothetical protein
MKTIIHIIILTLIATSLTLYTSRPVKERVHVSEMTVPLEKHLSLAIEKLVNIFPVKFYCNENMEDTSFYTQAKNYWNTILKEI